MSKKGGLGTARAPNTLEQDGSHDHCMLDNHSRMQQVMFEWLSTVFS